MERATAATKRVWLLMALTPVLWWLTHYVAVILHEHAHSFTGWITGIMANPFGIDWGGTSLHNILTLGNIDEGVDYDRAFATGHLTAAAITATAGPLVGNGLPYLIVRLLLRRIAAASRPWLLYTLFWYLVHNIGNYYAYMPLRVFMTHADVGNLIHGTDWNRWWVLAIGTYLTLWVMVDLYRRAMPLTLDAVGFGPRWAPRAVVLVIVTVTLFYLYAQPALEQPDALSAFMGQASVVAIPAVLVASWRRVVLGRWPTPWRRSDGAPEESRRDTDRPTSGASPVRADGRDRVG